jgi:thiamine-phosphate pyrophosphorylase
VAVEVPRLVVVADVDAAGGEAAWLRVLQRLGNLRLGTACAVQVRAKGRDGQALRTLARRARTAVADLRLVLNGPARLARDLGYTGVHWPESEVPPQVPPEASELLRSASAHSPAALRRADAVAHCVLFGPVFPPGSKEGAGVGVEALRGACRLSRLPVLAVGGITLDRVGACLEAGAWGVAVVTAVVRSPDPAAALLDFAARLAA